MGRLEKKVAIITGAADGIGLEMSRAFANEGAIVVMSDINIDKCKVEAKTIAKNSKNTIAKKCDVGNTQDVNKLIEFTIETYGRIDVLINNMGAHDLWILHLYQKALNAAPCRSF